MNLPFYIATRYLFSNKSTNVINIISAITILGVSIGTLSLVIVLSVFNGLEEIIVNRFSSFDSELKIYTSERKTFKADTVFYEKLNSCKQIEFVSETIEENALVEYKGVSNPYLIKGVSDNFKKITGIDTMMFDGDFKLYEQHLPVAIIGYSVAAELSVGISLVAPLKVYMPNRTKKMSTNPRNAFKTKAIYPVGIFSIDQDVDNIIIMPIKFVRELLNYNNEVTAVELKLKPNSNVDKVKLNLEDLLGKSYKIKNRFEQHEFLFKIMKSEKLIIFFILSFIILIASFNIISSLTMLLIEKKNDIETLHSLGATYSTIKKIFFFNGWLISIIGALLGIIFGSIICWIQIEFGIITLPGSENGGFLIDAYPVSMHVWDIVFVFLVVIFIGFITSFYPVQYIKKLQSNNNY